MVGAIGIVGIGWATVPTIGWRWLLGFAAIPVTVMTFFIPVSVVCTPVNLYECTVTVGLFVFLVVFQLIPSSPRYLIIKGKREQALRNINIVARINCKPKLHIKLVTDQEKAEMNQQDSLSKSSSEQAIESLVKDQDNGNLSGTSEDDVTVTLRNPSKTQESHPQIAKKSRVCLLCACGDECCVL